VDLINVFQYLKGGCKKDAIRLFSVVPSDRKRQWAQIEAREFPPEHRETLFYWRE